MLKNRKSPDRDLSRAEKREFQKADDCLNNLIRCYVTYKNNHIKEDKGYIYLDHRVMVFFDELNQKWKDFCHAYKTNPERHYRFDITLFRKKVDAHLARHRMLCWINYVTRICNIDHDFFPTQKMIQDIYPAGDIELLPDAAVPILKTNVRSFVMHTLEIPDINYSESFPSKITELSPKQFLYFIELFLQWKSDIINIDEFKTLLLLKLINIKYTARYDRMRRMYDKSPEIRDVKDMIDSNIHLLAQQIDSFFTEKILEDGQIEREIDMYFIKNMLPVIRVPFLKIFRRKYYGPGDALKNISWYEYRTAHSLYMSYLETKDDDTLCRIAAILYRPKKSFLFIRKWMSNFSGDVRIKISSQSNSIWADKRARRIQKASINNRVGILLFFRNCEEYIRYGKPRIDGQEIDLSIIYEGSPDHVSTGPDLGNTGILFTMAESGVFGTIEQVDGQYLYDILSRLYQVVKEANDTRETMIKNQPK